MRTGQIAIIVRATKPNVSYLHDFVFVVFKRIMNLEGSLTLNFVDSLGRHAFMLNILL